MPHITVIWSDINQKIFITQLEGWWEQASDLPPFAEIMETVMFEEYKKRINSARDDFILTSRASSWLNNNAAYHKEYMTIPLAIFAGALEPMVASV
jgi:hypothetical protein